MKLFTALTALLAVAALMQISGAGAGAKAYEPAELVTVIDNPPCLINCYTDYKVCNPTNKKMSLDELGFDVNFRTRKDMTLRKTNINGLSGYKVEIEHEITKTKQEPVYKIVTKQVSVFDNVTKKNITKNVDVTEFDRYNITSYKVKAFKPVSNDKLEPFDCYTIKVSGTKKPNENIEMVISYNGKNYE